MTAPQSVSSGTEPLRHALESIAGWRKVNISGEYEHGLRDIIRAVTDCAAAALDASPQVQEKVLHPLSEIREWDEALAVLGIQDSTQTPAEAIRELNTEIERLRTAAQGSPDRDELLRGLAAFFEESVHLVWSNDEIASCLIDMIGQIAQPSQGAGNGEAVAWEFRQRSGVGKGAQSQAPWCDWCSISRTDYELYLRDPSKLIEVRSLFAAPQPTTAGYPLPKHFADAYLAARKLVSDRVAAEVVSRNCSEGDGSQIDRIADETDAELVRRIVATYLAVSSTNDGSGA